MKRDALEPLGEFARSASAVSTFIRAAIADRAAPGWACACLGLTLNPTLTMWDRVIPHPLWAG
jgi:hypothetical protein